MEAVRDGLAEGMATCRRGGQEIEVRQLVTAMRHVEPTTRDRRAGLGLPRRRSGRVRHRRRREGLPAGALPAGVPDLLKQNNAYYTIHAGEADGVRVDLGGGAGLRGEPDRPRRRDHRRHQRRRDGRHHARAASPAYVRDEQIPLELCPSSNVQTGAVASIAEHPFRRLDELGFRVTVNSDNQLMSGTTLSREFSLLCEAFDYGLDDVRRLTVNAASVAFIGWDERQRLIDDVIDPGFARLRPSWLSWQP